MEENVVSIEKKINNARELDVYKRAFEISLDIHQASLHFPKIEQYALADQLRRSSKSICANLSEGFSKQGQSPAEFKRFVSVAIGSAGEVLTWLDYANRLDYISSQDYENWLSEYEIIVRMLQALWKKINV